MATALATLMSLPVVRLASQPSPVDDLVRLRAALGPSAPRLLMKRDDLLSFGCGGNKVRKIEAVAAEALAARADRLITCGGVQSNHARVTAAAGAALGLPVTLVLNGAAPDRPTANTWLDGLFGADIRYVPTREARATAMAALAAARQAAGERPFVIPLGASTPTGALGFARGLAEVASAGHRPQTIVTASSSGGTQAGLIAGAALLGLDCRILGVSADEPAPALGAAITTLLDAMAVRLGAKPASLHADRAVVIDDTEVGPGYGVPTAASTAALSLVARTEGILLDPVYTAKAMAGLLKAIRAGAFRPDDTVLVWHTGGQVANFA